MKNATLPPRYCEREIKDLEPGESAWATPGAMYVDSKRRCWLYGGYTTDHRQPQGTAMWIERTPEGFIVDLSNCRERRWYPGEEKRSSRLLPVVQVIEGGDSV